MEKKHYTYFIPRNDDAARKKSILLLEHQEPHPPILTEIKQVKKAASLIREIKTQSPRITVILDTACSVGREVLHGTRHLLRCFHCRYDNRFLLTQLHHSLRHLMPERLDDIEARRIFCMEAENMLFSRRNMGGARPCTEDDIKHVSLWMRNKNRMTVERNDPYLIKHPLYLFAQSFMEEAHRGNLETDHTHLRKEQELCMELFSCITLLMQSTFPDRPYPWFNSFAREKNRHADSSDIDDFIFAVLDGKSRKHRQLARRKPLQTRLVKAVDSYLKYIGYGLIQVFIPSVACSRYKRIRAFLDVMLGYWTQTLYPDFKDRPQLMDSSAFEKTAMDNLLISLHTSA